MINVKNWLQNNLSKIKEALFKTRSGLINQATTENADLNLNDDFYDDLFEKLIKADIGLELSEKIIEYLKKNTKEQTLLDNELKKRIKEAIKSVIASEAKQSRSNLPETERDCFVANAPRNDILKIFLIVGVNGSGKTTSIAKLANYFKEKGERVLICAADTFRAAAQEQLLIWADRIKVEIFAPKEIKKPDAVVYAALEKAKKEDFNILLIDTAGRLHSQTNLMDELKKIDSVIEKQVVAIHELPLLQIEKLIVLDATTGQNAITQAQLFSNTVSLTGIILAKLDSSAKGGVILNIMNKLSLPVKIIGTGEKFDDLAEFNLDEYLDGLLT